MIKLLPFLFALIYSDLNLCAQSPVQLSGVAHLATPHFGNDGSRLTSYVPGKSMFVRSLFFSRVPDLATYAAAFKSAGINTVEGGFYIPPGTGFRTEAAWQKTFDGSHAGVTEAIKDGFSLIFTGDDIARGSGAFYDACCGPSASWTPNPLTYAFTWLKSLDKTIGVEMVDEISSQFAVPFPQGQLGQPNGPQQLSCVNDLCTVTWQSPLVIENGALTFLIHGATSNKALNRPSTNLYHQNAGFNNGFTFNTVGVGTQTFTAATDPNLTFQMFASSGKLGPNGNDYVHNDATSKIMGFVDAGPHPSITWPVAAAAPPANFGAWAGPGASDYGDLYFTYLGCNGVSGGLPLCLPNDALRAFNQAWNNKATFAQKGKPLLMETSDYGPSYNIGGVPVPVTSFDGNTMVFSQPHGITTPVAGLTRLTLSGNSNSALNGNYYAYGAPNPTTLRVYQASPTGPNTPGGTVTFADGQSINLAVFPTLGSLSPTSMQFNGGVFCLHPANFNARATVSASTNVAYDGKWYVLPSTFNGLDSNGCAWNIRMSQLVIGTIGAGGTASIIADNYYHAGVSTLTQNGVTPDIAAANVMYAAEKGAAGVRVYMFGEDANQNRELRSCFSNCGNYGGGGQNTHVDPNPLFNGPTAQATWRGISNAFNLISTLEPFLLQPQLPAPNYGPTMVTAARTSSYGTLLLMTEFANTSQTMKVDLRPYNPSGGAGTMYTMTGEQSTKQSVSGTSMQVTFAPAQTVAFTFPH
jgi:hypothetical protein